MHASILHGARKSWSDTVGVQGPCGKEVFQRWVSGPAEDFRPVSEVEAGVNFRPTGSTSQDETRHRYQAGQGKCGHTFPPPGGSWYPIRVTWKRIGHQAINGLDEGAKGYRQSLYVPCQSCPSSGGMDEAGAYKTAWVTPGHDCLCSYKYGHGATVRPQTNNAIWDGVIGLWGRVAPFLSPWCGKKDVPTGVHLNQYAGPGSFIRWRICLSSSLV